MKMLLALSILLAPLAASAEELNLRTITTATATATPNRFSITTGAEYGFVAGIGYSRVVPVLDRHVVLLADATLPWASFDLADFRVRAGALVPIIGSGGWQLAGALRPSVRHESTSISRLTNVGLDTSLVGGYYGRSWFVALESGLDLALSTHIAHSDAYRMDAYADAKDGWYSDPGANIRGGVQAGVSMSRYDVTLRLGQVRDSTGEAPLLPFYGTLTAATRW